MAFLLCDGLHPFWQQHAVMALLSPAYIHTAVAVLRRVFQRREYNNHWRRTAGEKSHVVAILVRVVEISQVSGGVAALFVSPGQLVSKRVCRSLKL